MDHGFCGLDLRPWLKSAVKESDFGNSTDMNLVYYEELKTLSQMNLKLTLEPSDKQFSGKPLESKRFKRPYWIKGNLPQLSSFRLESISVPKIKVKSSIDSGRSINQQNPVFRSNSFRYKKCFNNRQKDDKNFLKQSSSNKVRKIICSSQKH